MKLLLLLLASIIGQLCLAEETAETTPETPVPYSDPSLVKDETGAGRYKGGRSYKNRQHDYGHEYGQSYRTPTVDDYVCNLDATVLVVSSKHYIVQEKYYGGGKYHQGSYGGGSSYGGDQKDSYGGGSSYGGDQKGSYGGGSSYGGDQKGSYGGGSSYSEGSYGGSSSYGEGSYGGGSSYGNQGYESKPKHEYAAPQALRLKCSHIATYSEYDCQTCCRLSARRYHGYSKAEIFGFIVNADEIKYDGGKGSMRYKRSTDNGFAPSPGYDSSSPAPSNGGGSSGYSGNDYGNQNPSYSSGSGYSGSYSGSTYGGYSFPKNPRCVCCSPKRHHYDDYHHRSKKYDQNDSYDEY